MRRIIFLLIVLSIHAYGQQVQWTWMNGSNYQGATAGWGTQDVFAAGNTPGATYEAEDWADKQGYFWLLDDYIDVMEGIIDIPNVFTPNNDGYNDFFEVRTSGMKTFNFEIFNRWGMLIFESNSTNIQWDGYNQAGLQCADGTYYYVLKASSYTGKNYGRAGFVTLIR